MRPSIALLTSADDCILKINQDYIKSILNAGGIPTVLPYTADGEKIKEYVRIFDGFLFCGGDDIDPSLYGEENNGLAENICSKRDDFEKAVFEAVYPTGKPILGICRGEQLINALLGGSLYQHIDGHRQDKPRDETAHMLRLVRGGFLSELIKTDEISTNTFHHQAVKLLAPCLVADAFGYDGIVEAYHSATHPYCIGVQWHPENLYETQKSSRLIFDSFIRATSTAK